MQTFLPYPDFQKSVACLDSKRLGKQRVEAYQILTTLTTGRKAWANHPATLMWRGYEDALKLYMNATITEWVFRGFNNSMMIADVKAALLPPWFGNEELHASHRANLLRKDKNWYGRFGWTEDPELPYIWPVRKAS